MPDSSSAAFRVVRGEWFLASCELAKGWWFLASCVACTGEGTMVLAGQSEEEGLDVCILLVCSDQFAYTGPFLQQSVETLDRIRCGALSGVVF